MLNRNQHEPGMIPKRGGDMFFRKVGWLLRTIRPYIPEDRLLITTDERASNPKTTGLFAA
jgi:hypothetical protein